MILASDAETIPLELNETSVPVLLYAGGTTGLVLVAGSDSGRAFCGRLGELAETVGLSALAFADEIPGDVALAALRSSELLESLGVKQTVLVALGAEAVPALRAAGGGRFEAVVLIEPIVPLEEIEPLLEKVPMAKLILVRGDDSAAQEIAAAVLRHAIGPLAVQHLPGETLVAGETAAMVADATLAFAVGACGAGRCA